MNGPLETIACPCGTVLPPREAFRTPTRRYCLCPACGLVFFSPRPSKRSVMEFYREEYDTYVGESESGPERAPVYRSVLNHLSRFRLPPGRLLDVGCGDGEFLALCRAQGWTCSGVEISNKAAERALQRGVTLLPADWLDQTGAGERTGAFDVIVLLNVLESVLDPTVILRRVRTALAPDGLVAIRVSNGAFHLAVRRPAWWVGARDQQAFHFFVYTPQALVHHVQSAGFDVVSVRNSRMSEGPVRVANWFIPALWRVGGAGLWLAAQGLYWLTGGRAVWAPSFEVIARRTKDGAA